MRFAFRDASHLRHFHRRRFALIGNLVPPWRQYQTKLRSLDDSTILRIAVCLYGELLRRSVYDFDNLTFDEDLGWKLRNHSPDAHALTDEKLKRDVDVSDPTTLRNFHCLLTSDSVGTLSLMTSNRPLEKMSW